MWKIINKITDAIDGLMDFILDHPMKIFFAVVALIILTVDFPKDSTDSVEARSGLSLYTDYSTGCQYVSAGGGITPRMGKDGKQICGKDQ